MNTQKLAETAWGLIIVHGPNVTKKVNNNPDLMIEVEKILENIPHIESSLPKTPLAVW